MAADLQSIMTKVRRLTRTPSEAQLSNAELQEYINTFIVYDFPEHIRTFNKKIEFTWTCNAFQDTYSTDITNPAWEKNPLFDFKNLYITVHPPLYIAGFSSMFSQSPEQFYGIYPKVRSIAQIGSSGDGVTTTFTGQINTNQSILSPGQVTQQALLQGQVLFSSIDSNGNSLAMVDLPVINTGSGNPTINGNLYPSGSQFGLVPIAVDPTNTINYVTGRFTVTFQNQLGAPTAPGAGIPINSQTVPQALGRPQSMLFFDNTFVLRPVPDQPYSINFEVYKRFDALVGLNDDPELQEYWQYIAYGAAKKIFEDRMDMDSVAMIMPEFKTQQQLMLRRTNVQLSNERTATIYTEQSQYGYGSGGFGWGGGGQF